jgi:hypothetical protein
VLERLLRVGRRENRGGDRCHSHVEEERGVRSARHSHEQGPPAGSSAGAMEAAAMGCTVPSRGSIRGANTEALTHNTTHTWPE